MVLFDVRIWVHLSRSIFIEDLIGVGPERNCFLLFQLGYPRLSEWYCPHHPDLNWSRTLIYFQLLSLIKFNNVYIVVHWHNTYIITNNFTHKFIKNHIWGVGVDVRGRFSYEISGIVWPNVMAQKGGDILITVSIRHDKNMLCSHLL